MRLLLCTITALLMAVSLHAENEQDFLGLLMAELNINNLGDEEDYACATVSPAMMEKMLQMMQTSDAEKQEPIEHLLPHIKSMRIFTASKRPAKYSEACFKLLARKSKSYKPFSADAKEGKKPCVWVRRDGKKVVEMIVVNRKEEQSFHVINLTGDMSRAFVNELLKL